MPSFLTGQMYEDAVIVTTAVDILNQIADFNSSILRDYTLPAMDSNNEVGMSPATMACVIIPIVSSSSPFLLSSPFSLLPFPAHSLPQDAQFMNIIISLLVDGEFSGTWGTLHHFLYQYPSPIP